MKYRVLGSTGLVVSEISLGCSGYWGNVRFDEDAAIRIVREAYDNGVNLFDTGHNYSNFNAEPRLGRAIQDILKRYDRSSLVISTKAGTIKGSWLTPRISPSQDFLPDSIEKSCLRSIQRLGCDYIDIFQLHGITRDLLTPALIDRLEQMRAKGHFRFLGINTHDVSMMEHLASIDRVCDVVLIDYNVIQLDREPIILRLAQSGIGILAGTILAQGHLVRSKIGSVRNGSFFWYLARTLLKPSSRRLALSSSSMRKVLQAVPGMTAAQVAFAYSLSNPYVSSCIVGTTSIANLLEAVASVEMGLDEKILSKIRQTFDSMKDYTDL
jgi:aryl-alcohol dehydrogenase-like predicted oxidoreductase